MVWSQYSILNIVIHGAQTPKYKIVYVNHLPEYCPVMGFDSIGAHPQSKPNLSTSPPVRILMIPNQLHLKPQQGRAPRNIKTVPPQFS